MITPNIRQQAELGGAIISGIVSMLASDGLVRVIAVVGFIILVIAYASEVASRAYKNYQEAQKISKETQTYTSMSVSNIADSIEKMQQVEDRLNKALDELEKHKKGPERYADKSDR